MFDPISNQLQDIISLPEDIPFKTGKELAIKLPINDTGITDIYIYIDDSIGVAPDIDTNPSRVNKAIALTINSIARPLDNNDTIPRNPVLSQKKLLAEGRVEECKIVLGWFIDTRSMQVALPSDKHKKWLFQIEKVLSGKRVSEKQLEVLIGRLNHIGTIIPML